jgi:uncharacterized protein HemX
MSDMQTSRAVWAPPPRARDAKPHHAADGRRAPSQNPVRFATGVALVIALVATAVAIEGFMQASRSQQRIVALQAELSGFQRRIGVDEQRVAGERQLMRRVAARAAGAQHALDQVSWQLQSLPSEAEVARVRGALAAFAGCIPRLQGEIDGLGIVWKINPKKPAADYFKLFTPTAPKARSCSAR